VALVIKLTQLVTSSFDLALFIAYIKIKRVGKRWLRYEIGVFLFRSFQRAEREIACLVPCLS